MSRCVTHRVTVMSPASCCRAVLFCVVLACLARPAAAQTTVVSCGQMVTGTGVLTADLDCSAFAGPSAVILSASGSLDLAGFALHGPLVGEAVRCDGDCTITSSAAGGMLVLSNGASDIDASVGMGADSPSR